MKEINQTQIILDHLKQGKTINQVQAYQLCFCTRLSSIIYALRKKGYDIITHEVPNKINSSRHAEYELKINPMAK